MLCCLNPLFHLDDVLIQAVDAHSGDIEVDFIPGRALDCDGQLCVGLHLPEIGESLPRPDAAICLIAASASRGDYALSKEGGRWTVWKLYASVAEDDLAEALREHARFTRSLSAILRRPPARRAPRRYG
jgi:hypothetical protein